jgi:galactoside O-acetyltransferase
MNNNSFFNKVEIRKLGLKSVGEDILKRRKISIYNYNKVQISIDNNARIDFFCILLWNITIENHLHISAYDVLYGTAGIILKELSGISARKTIYSLTDDFLGENLIGVILPDKYRNVNYGKVIFKRFCYVGAHSVILPNVIINEGTVIGAMSLINNITKSWSIYV